MTAQEQFKLYQKIHYRIAETWGFLPNASTMQKINKALESGSCIVTWRRPVTEAWNPEPWYLAKWQTIPRSELCK